MLVHHHAISTIFDQARLFLYFHLRWIILFDMILQFQTHLVNRGYFRFLSNWNLFIRIVSVDLKLVRIVVDLLQPLNFKVDIKADVTIQGRTGNLHSFVNTRLDFILRVLCRIHLNSALILTWSS